MDEQPGKPVQQESLSPPAPRRPAWKRRLLIGALVVAGLAAILAYGVPWVRLALNTVSTDDAYVNGHVTFVAARVRGQVARVLVDDNNRVRKGDLLVELDKEPFQVAVAVKTADVDVASAELRAATARVRGIEATARSAHWKLQHAMEDVDNQVALLHARVADVDKSQANVVLAQLDFDRAAKLVSTDDIPRQEYDRRQAALLVGPRERDPGAGRRPSDPRLPGIAAATSRDRLSARFRPISTRSFHPCCRRRRS